MITSCSMTLQSLFRVSPAFMQSLSRPQPAWRTLFTYAKPMTPTALSKCNARFDQYRLPQNTDCISSVSPRGFPLHYKQCVRFYMRKKTIRTGPTKPLSFDYSGDLVTMLAPVDPTSPKPGFEDVEELSSAEEDVKNIFSIAFADGGQIKQKRLNDLLSVIREHPADIQSLEVKIATKTLLLRNAMRHCLDFRKDKVAKSMLVKLIHRRNRQLRQLRSHDMEKFEWLLEELKIKYVPEKTYKDYKVLSRRAARKKAARDNFFTTKKEKLQQLRQHLASERVEFEKEKDEELAGISRELEAMGISEMDSVDSVLQAIGMEKYMEKPEKRMKRRYLILAKKFALHEERMKAEKQES